MPLDIDMSESIWAIQGTERGLKQGLDQGLRQGLKQGEAQILHRQLNHLFGPLATSVQDRLSQATKEQLEDWSLRTLRAQSLAEVFSD